MKATATNEVARFADMFAAMGSESRVRIVQRLLAAHPDGLTVGEIQASLGISPSNMSHHLEKLKHEGLVEVQREGTYLRCRASVAALRELLSFLYSECCTRSKAVNPKAILQAGKPAR